MLKDELNKEPALQNRLDEYEVNVPQSLAHLKRIDGSALLIYSHRLRKIH